MSKVLVIDDEELFRQATVCALQRKGFEAHEAPDGAAGAELARRLLPDVIVCDINMAKMDGYAVLESLRQEPSTATIPFILMTGMGDPDLMRRGMNLGADDYLTKPFTSAQLYSAVDARLKKNQVLRANAERKLADLRANLSLALPHEMITPLNGIFGLAQILSTAAQSLTSAEVAEYGTTILESAERLHHTVQNFLLYGQLEMKASDPSSIAALLERVTRDPRQIIEARARRLAGRFQRAGDLQFEAAQAAVAIGQDLFTKLLDELVENAFKFSTAGTPVRISGAAEESNYCLTVTDQGRGLDPAQVAAIGAYTQFDRKENEQQGSGLGLTIARRIADLHGGQLTLKSARQAGTTVHVKLPLAAAKPAA
jgi:signal transduction histidine kinase